MKLSQKHGERVSNRLLNIATVKLIFVINVTYVETEYFHRGLVEIKKIHISNLSVNTIISTKI